jgi:hypothetical protein
LLNSGSTGVAMSCSVISRSFISAGSTGTREGSGLTVAIGSGLDSGGGSRELELLISSQATIKTLAVVMTKIPFVYCDVDVHDAKQQGLWHGGPLLQKSFALLSLNPQDFSTCWIVTSKGFPDELFVSMVNDSAGATYVNHRSPLRLRRANHTAEGPHVDTLFVQVMYWTTCPFTR